MNMFQNARVVKLRSYHENKNKYLRAVDDQKSVIQGDNVSTKNDVEWTVEFVPGSDSLIRLKSCYGKYLTASDKAFLLGFTGFQVHQTLPGNLDSSIEWEPIRGGNQIVKLKNSRHDTFLRANNNSPPWRYSVTHKVPLRSSANSFEWHLLIVATTEQPSSSTTKMNAEQRVPARAPAPASRQGFMQSANLAVNTANLIARATTLATTFTNPGDSDAGNAPMGDTTGLSDAGNADMGDALEWVDTGNADSGFSDFISGSSMGDAPEFVDAGNADMGDALEWVDAGNADSGILDFISGFFSS